MEDSLWNKSEILLSRKFIFIAPGELSRKISILSLVTFVMLFAFGEFLFLVLWPLVVLTLVQALWSTIRYLFNLGKLEKADKLILAVNIIVLSLLVVFLASSYMNGEWPFRVGPSRGW